MALENSVLFEGISRSGLLGLLSPLMRGRATIFMLHRFQDPARGVRGHDPDVLRAVLARFRRDGHAFVSVESLVRSMLQGEPAPAGAVAFTIDDGYYDHAEIAGPIFAEFDAPVTTFVTTGFLDRELWFWWDRIEYIFRHFQHPEPELEVGGDEIRYALTSESAVRDAQADFLRRCKAVPEEEKNVAIDRLAGAAEVELPHYAPAEYAPMSWDQLREREALGMSFGPHTRTHPILARASDEQVEREISESWTRLSAEARAPAPVFCYPNGQRGDFGEREFAVLERLGLLAAVVGTPGYLSPAALRSPTARFQVPRYSYPDSVNGAIRYASGMERALQVVRGRV